jgi:hypothetical protein
VGRELIKPEKKAGRPKGSRTALTAKVIDDILRHWKKNGANALDEMFDKDPSSYVRTIASLIPRDVKVQTDINVSFIDAIKEIEQRTRLEAPVTVLEIESSPVCGGSISDQAGEVAEESSGIDSNE